MQKKFQLGVIGGGFMAHAIIEGILKKKNIPAEQILVSEPQKEKVHSLREHGVVTTTDNRYLAENSQYVLFAVKPQTFALVAEEIKGIALNNAISIMAGVTKESIKNATGVQNVARAMPNLPCSVGKGMIGIDTSDYEVEGKKFIHSVFRATGKVEEVKESLLNAVTGVSGSGPAYVYLFMQALTEAGVAQGMSARKAKKFALQTLKGGVQLVEKNPKKSLQELIDAVSSKGGTTVAALNQFAADNFKGSVHRAVDAAVKRAEELSK